MAARTKKYSALRHHGLAFFAVGLFFTSVFLTALVLLGMQLYSLLGLYALCVYGWTDMTVGFMGAAAAMIKGAREGEGYEYTFAGAAVLGLIIALMLSGLLLGFP
jgi:tetrahydromethanopterin S-methyltransferase subunit F